MTRYSNPAKKPGQYLSGLRAHWKKKRRDPRYTDKRNTAVNECWTPSNEASRADLREFHQENMKLRRRRQLEREPNVLAARPTKNDDPAYRKSIWPEAKLARLGPKANAA